MILSYDYSQAPWPEDRLSGNGGFALRSKKLCELAADLDMAPHFPQRGLMDNEDVLVCRTYREYFVDNGCRFAPAEVAEKFSQNTMLQIIDILKTVSVFMK